MTARRLVNPVQRVNIEFVHQLLVVLNVLCVLMQGGIMVLFDNPSNLPNCFFEVTITMLTASLDMDPKGALVHCVFIRRG